MGKVILERRRVGGLPKKGEKRALSRMSLDDLPTREKMSAGWRERKESRDRRTPLLRYLRSQVGRPWNDIYSEICRNVRRDCYARHRILDLTLTLDVQVNVVMVDGVPHESDGRKVYYGDFWVHPETGQLMAPQGRPRYRFRPRHKFAQVPVSAMRKYVNIDGLWFIVSFASLPADVNEPVFDVVFKEELTEDKHGRRRWRCRAEWGSEIYAVSKRQIGKREIRHVLAQQAKEAA